MNLIKNFAIKRIPQVVGKTFVSSPKRTRVAQGLCLTCDNRKHCVWQENKKQFCEHFE